MIPDPYWCPICQTHHPVTQLVRDHVANGGLIDRREKEVSPMDRCPSCGGVINPQTAECRCSD